MKYRIENISVSSVLKQAFLILMAVGTLVALFLQLIIARLTEAFPSAFSEFDESLGLVSNHPGLAAMILAAILNGILFSIIFTFLILVIIILYNLFARYFGGIEIELDAIETPEPEIPRIPNDTTED